jgi:hypothetical protein
MSYYEVIEQRKATEKAKKEANFQRVKSLIHAPVTDEEIAQENGSYVVTAYRAAQKYLRAPIKINLSDSDMADTIEFGLRLLKPYKMITGHSFNNTSPADYPDVDDSLIVKSGVLTFGMTHAGAVLVRRKAI